MAAQDDDLKNKRHKMALRSRHTFTNPDGVLMPLFFVKMPALAEGKMQLRRELQLVLARLFSPADTWNQGSAREIPSPAPRRARVAQDEHNKGEFDRGRTQYSRVHNEVRDGLYCFCCIPAPTL